MAVRDNTKAGNSVKQTSSVLHVRGCVHLPLQQFYKIIMSPDSTFYKLHSDIYFAKVLSQAMLIRTIFRKTLLKVYSNLNTLIVSITNLFSILVELEFGHVAFLH